MQGHQGHPSVSLSWEQKSRRLWSMPTASPRLCWPWEDKHSEFCSLLCPQCLDRERSQQVLRKPPSLGADKTLTLSLSLLSCDMGMPEPQGQECKCDTGWDSCVRQ